ncbi:hypothetical protein Ancab_004543, partial [Ancistrocladus abbreviatus]
AEVGRADNDNQLATKGRRTEREEDRAGDRTAAKETMPACKPINRARFNGDGGGEG